MNKSVPNRVTGLLKPGLFSFVCQWASLLPVLFFSVAFSAVSLAADAEIDSEETVEKARQRQQLETVQKQIKASEQAIENQQVKQKFLSDLLKKAEKEISDVARQLNKVSKDKKSSQKKLAELKQEKNQLKQEQQVHKKLLASQLASMYVTGNHDYSKLLLNQQEPGKLERVLGYYQYLNKARTQSLDRIEGILERLTQIDRQQAETLIALTQMEQNQLTKQLQLTKHQRNRKQTLVKIRRRLKTESQQLEQLKRNEQALTAALKAIRSMTTQAIELLGLSRYKGQLGWPVNGKLNNRFGRKRRGSLRWKGVVIDSVTGTPVKTVHQGQVLYADWLKGFGWVIVVDHGDGYMSLYGHNQTLLKAVGEKVEAGEPIALVGKSGGQSRAGLYFEIRHQGIAINPAIWCKKGV